ncbi:MAG: divalent-cation tolerance protein CutA [Gammaproteobacteria bacterium]|nr:MAG: divalent-cation tolerance protein CutA [Gammaproteobacteria bacterium]
MPETPAPHRLVFCTVPDRATAERLARLLVEESLAACVNIVDGLTSVYRWRGRIETDRELLLLAKTRAECLERLTARVRSAHPYELPEIIAVPVTSGLAEYLAWIDANLDLDEEAP